MRTNSWNNYILKQHETIPIFTLEEYIAGNSTTLFKWKCVKCGKEFYSAWNNGYTCGCPVCSPKPGRKMQTEIADYIRSLGITDIKIDDRSILKSRELDIYSPSCCAAVELDGLFWHTVEGFVLDKDTGRTTGAKTISYHLDKTVACSENGIKLVHITDDEWIYDKKLSKAIIRRAFGVKRPICSSDIRKINHDLACIFINKYSMNKCCKASVYYGLYYNNKLASVLAAVKSFGRVAAEWTILNYAVINSFDINNGFLKLFDYFVADVNPSSVIMYVDRRFAYEDQISDAMVFKCFTKPNYYWVNSTATKKYSRGSFNAKKITGYDENKSTLENMRAAGYRRIFDCGDAVFVWRPSSK